MTGLTADPEQRRIRPYRSDDLDALYEVCLQTGDAGADATGLYRDPQLLGHLYVGPYACLEPRFAFVLEDGAGVCGYVLGAPDTTVFLERLLSEWLPPLRKRYPAPRTPAEAWSRDEHLQHQLHHPSLAVPADLAAHPSHLHIDLKARAQGRGHGRRMMETLLEALAAAGSPGVHLGVAARNDRARRFYGKLGFSELPAAGDAGATTVIMGRSLN